MSPQEADKPVRGLGNCPQVINTGAHHQIDAEVVQPENNEKRCERPKAEADPTRKRPTRIDGSCPTTRYIDAKRSANPPTMNTNGLANSTARAGGLGMNCTIESIR